MNFYTINAFNKNPDKIMVISIYNFIKDYAQNQYNTTPILLVEENHKSQGKHLNSIDLWALKRHNIIFQCCHEFSSYTLPPISIEDIKDIEQQADELLATGNFDHLAEFFREEISRLNEQLNQGEPREIVQPTSCKFTIGYPDQPNLTSEEIRERFIAEWGDYESKV